MTKQTHYYHPWYGAAVLKPQNGKMAFIFCDSSGYMQEYLYDNKTRAHNLATEHGWELDEVMNESEAANA